MNRTRTPQKLHEVGRLLFLAHHADCYRYDHHLVRPFGVSLCLGCTFAYAGSLLGSLTWWSLIHEQWSVVLTLCLVYSCLIPSLVQPYFQQKFFKVFSRTLLGVASAVFILYTAFSLEFTWLGLSYRILALVLFIKTRRGLMEFRQKRLDDPCLNCPHGAKPFCYHYHPELKSLYVSLKESDDSEAELIAGLIASIEDSSHAPISPVNARG
jgi:hypothetical protein